MTPPRSVESRIWEIFERLGLDVESATTDVFATGVLSSLSFVELLTALEDAFGIRFQLADLEPSHFCSVEAITGFVSATLCAGAHRESRSA